jgi:hypothetical protein
VEEPSRASLVLVKLPLRNGNRSGNRTRDILYVREAPYQLSYPVKKYEQGADERVYVRFMITLVHRLEMVFGEGLEPSFAGP